MTDLGYLAEKINDYWLLQETDIDGSHWRAGTYFVGCMAAYRMTGKKAYLDAAVKWAQDSQWSFYMNTKHQLIPTYYKNADNITCAQVYFELLDLLPGCGTDEKILHDLLLTIEDAESDYWAWCDLIYMGLPTYHLYAGRYHDDRFIEKAHQLFLNIRDERGLYDREAHLWYRDENWLPDKKLTPGGRKVFWGRGNGWVLAGRARGMEFLDKDAKYYEEYQKVFCEMAEALLPWQQEDGMWRCSLIDPKQYDIPEASATALISYGLAKGIELGVLDREKYLPVVLKAFGVMKSMCIDEEGRLGYVQGVAGWPGPVTPEGTAGYAVGTFILLCEVLQRL